MSAACSNSFESSTSPSASDLIPVHYYTSRLEKTRRPGSSDIEDRAWRADLRALILKDLAQGAFGTRRHRISGPNVSYALTYQIDMPDEALCRFALDPTGVLDDPDTPTLFEVFECAKIWISGPQSSDVEAISSRNMIQQGKTQIKCNGDTINHFAFPQCSISRVPRTYSTIPTPNSLPKATPYSGTKGSRRIAWHHPRGLSGDDG